MIDSVNTIKDKIGTIIDKITQIDTDHQSLMGQLLRSTNLSSKATTVSLKTKYNKKVNMQNFTNSIRQDLAPVKMIYENEIPTKEHEHDKSSLHEEEKHSSQYNTHLSKSKKSNYQLQDNSLMSQILNEIEPRENHKENIKSINKIVDNEMQDLSKSKPKIKKRTKKAAVVPNNEVASSSSVSQSDNQNLDESSHEHLQVEYDNSQNDQSNIYDKYVDDSNQQQDPDYGLQESDNDDYSGSYQDSKPDYQLPTRSKPRISKKQSEIGKSSELWKFVSK